MLDKLKVVKEMDRDTLISVARTSLHTKLNPEVADVLTEVLVCVRTFIDSHSSHLLPYLPLPHPLAIQVIVDAVLAVRKPGELIDLHMVEVMQMMHKTDTETRLVG